MTRRRDAWLIEELGSGALARVSPVVDDPGNPAGALALFNHRMGGRSLIAANATPLPDGTHELVSLRVPRKFTDPLTAVAWTYDDETHPVRCTPALYARLSRRT
jgi:hypothetical protein